MLSRSVYCQITRLLSSLAACVLVCGLSGAVALAQNDRSAVAYHVNKGNELLNNGKVKESMGEFAHALDIDAQCPEALSGLGNCYLHTGDNEKAEQDFRSALKSSPNYMPALNGMGEVCYLKNNLDEAANFFEQALAATNNQDPEVQVNLANVLRDKGSYDEALDHYRQAVKIKPDSAFAYNNLGYTLYLRERYPEALIEVSKATKLKPDYAEAYYYLGLIYRKLNRPADAKTSWQTSLKYETNPEYRESTNKLLREMSQAKSAIDHLAKGMDLMSDHKYALAQKEFNLALNGDKAEDAVALNNLGLSLAKQNQYPQAIAAYKKAISFKPKFAQAYYNLGQALRSQGDLAGAKKAFQSSLSLSSGANPLAHNCLAMLLKQSGDLTGAVSEYRKAIVESGDALSVVHFNLALALEAQNEMDKAAGEYKIYLQKSPNGLNARQAQMHLLQLEH